MTETIFTTRGNLADSIRARFIVDGMSEADDVINDAIEFLEGKAREIRTEGAEIRSEYLGVRVILTAYADVAREAVKAGTAALDSIRHDDWRALINRDTLDVSNTNNCLLGQLYGSYGAGMDAIIDAFKGGIQADRGWGRRNAFIGCSNDDSSACCGSVEIPMSILTLAWLELLGPAAPISDPLLGQLNA